MEVYRSYVEFIEFTRQNLGKDFSLFSQETVDIKTTALR